jgi:ABC-type Fe3+ transport system substrate-binding protein
MGALVLPTAVAALARAPHAAAAAPLLDRLVSAETERLLAAAGAHFPLRSSVPPPTGMRPLAEIRAMNVDLQAVAAAMERLAPWVRSWSER